MWREENNQLTKEFNFVDFNSALNFVNKINKGIEELGHHPQIIISWGKLIISTTTHDAGNKITEKDLELTKYIDHCYEQN
ncbi:MAG: 4a-hydroxytetrahydrobiopterin dehydratase [Patescibacteria group bacterium]